jgi:hypothetical protein
MRASLKKFSKQPTGKQPKRSSFKSNLVLLLPKDTLFTRPIPKDLSVVL